LGVYPGVALCPSRTGPSLTPGYCQVIPTGFQEGRGSPPFGDQGQTAEETPHPLIPVTHSRPLARPSRAFADGKFLSPLPKRLKSPVRAGRARMGRGRIKFWASIPGWRSVRAGLAPRLPRAIFRSSLRDFKKGDTIPGRPVGYKHNAPAELARRTDGGSIKKCALQSLIIA